MYKLNENYGSLQENYLFAEVAKRVSFYENTISLGIGDVTKPLIPVVVEALHKAAGEMGEIKTFRGYGPANGYEFLRNCIAKEISVDADEVFISDGAKSDLGNLQELFSKECIVAICNPSYPVYVETNQIAGRNIQYLTCDKEHDFLPKLPKNPVDIIYLCSPNNPTGTAMKKEELQKWVDYAIEQKAVIIYDAAYEAYIEEAEVPHSIYECEGAKKCAVEIRSFSKNAGFTGLRLGALILPKELPFYKLWVRRQSVRYNGAPYIVQRAAEAIYTDEGQKQINEQICYYKKNARHMLECLQKYGYKTYGGINSPYVWMEAPNSMSSWEFFDLLMEKTSVVTTPGIGFGSDGEGYMRLSALNTYENTVEAMERMKSL